MAPRSPYFLQHYYHPLVWMERRGFIGRRINPVSCNTSRRAMDSDADERVVVQRYPTKNLNSKFCKRRELLLEAAAGFSLPLITRTNNSSSPSTVALADEGAAVQEFRLYVDDVNKFKILIPPDWEVASGESEGFKSLTAFYLQEPSNSNFSIVISGLGGDFTRLEFGKVDEFAENLIGGLDRSWQRPPGVAAKLLDSKSANGLYYIEYTLQNPDETRRHLFSVLGIANNGWYKRLYTLAGQFVDEEAEKYGPAIEKAVASFRLS